MSLYHKAIRDTWLARLAELDSGIVPAGRIANNRATLVDGSELTAKGPIVNVTTLTEELPERHSDPPHALRRTLTAAAEYIFRATDSERWIDYADRAAAEIERLTFRAMFDLFQVTESVAAELGFPTMSVPDCGPRGREYSLTQDGNVHVGSVVLRWAWSYLTEHPEVEPEQAAPFVAVHVDWNLPPLDGDTPDASDVIVLPQE